MGGGTVAANILHSSDSRKRMSSKEKKTVRQTEGRVTNRNRDRAGL